MMYGLDVGGTKIELAIFDDQQEKQESWRVTTPGDNYQDFIDAIVGMVRQADSKSGNKGSVGIGLPGIANSDGKGVSSNVPCINGQSLVHDISQALDRPVGFENDVRAFVYSEANGGAADGFKHMLGVVIGTGFAGGLCINGELYYGRQNIAGEYGHVVLPSVLQQRYNFPVRDCGCGATGCVETYLSGAGLLWMCGHFGAKFESVSSMIDAMRAGDLLATKVFDAYIDCLGCHFAELTMMFDPDVIVLGGGLSNIDEIYEQIPVAIQTYLFESVTPPAVVKPKFGDSSGVRGAALIGLRAAQDAVQAQPKV